MPHGESWEGAQGVSMVLNTNPVAPREVTFQQEGTGKDANNTGPSILSTDMCSEKINNTAW